VFLPEKYRDVLDKLKLGFDDVYTMCDPSNGASGPPGWPG
jgi:hypothetical protein